MEASYSLSEDKKRKANKIINNQEFENIILEKSIGKSIESLYILKYIFSFLSEDQKLKIIIYNKNLQKKLDINIENYERIRGIYKEFEKNGRVKEYNKYGKLIFEGEYLNRKRNRKRKEYDYFNGQLIFEGEYLNGERNGKGKEYYDNDKLKFEGEYLNGRRWNGKGYSTEGQICFEIKEGNGKGKEYYNNDKLKFEGEYLNGKKNECQIF